MDKMERCINDLLELRDKKASKKAWIKRYKQKTQRNGILMLICSLLALLTSLGSTVPTMKWKPDTWSVLEAVFYYPLYLWMKFIEFIELEFVTLWILVFFGLVTVGSWLLFILYTSGEYLSFKNKEIRDNLVDVETGESLSTEQLELLVEGMNYPVQSLTKVNVLITGIFVTLFLPWWDYFIKDFIIKPREADVFEALGNGMMCIIVVGGVILLGRSIMVNKLSSVDKRSKYREELIYIINQEILERKFKGES